MTGAWQVAQVSKVLGSVDRAVDAGNKVVFDSTGSYIYHKPTGQTTQMYRENGEFKYDLWIPRPRSVPEPANEIKITKGQYAVLQEITEQLKGETDFPRQDPL